MSEIDVKIPTRSVALAYDWIAENMHEEDSNLIKRELLKQEVFIGSKMVCQLFWELKKI